MTCSIYCHSGRQPCPTPRNCGEGCHFTNATLETPRDKAERQFIEMDLPIEMQPDMADEAIAWFQRWAKFIAVACFAVAAAVTYFGRAV